MPTIRSLHETNKAIHFTFTNSRLRRRHVGLHIERLFPHALSRRRLLRSMFLQSACLRVGQLRQRRTDDLERDIRGGLSLACSRKRSWVTRCFLTGDGKVASSKFVGSEEKRRRKLEGRGIGLGCYARHRNQTTFDACRPPKYCLFAPTPPSRW